MEEKKREVSFHQSLIRPQLLGGCDRELFIMLGGISFSLGGIAGLLKGSIINFLAGICLFLVGKKALAYMARRDPHLRMVFSRSMKYGFAYSARGDARNKEKIAYKRWA